MSTRQIRFWRDLSIQNKMLVLILPLIVLPMLILAAVGFKFLPPEEQRILELIHDLGQGRIDVITFTSPMNAKLP